jgi:polar amino acid transport system substrate-binding protein
MRNQPPSALTGLLRALALVCALALCLPGSGLAQQGESAPAEPESSDVRRPKPDYQDIERIRFLTDSDYPPFNYYDEEGALTGFNVDLARAVCDELIVECDVVPLDWAELVPTLKRNEADAVIASIRPNKQTLEELDFTESYYHTPARFIMRKGEFEEVSQEALGDKKIGVVANSAHQAFLGDFFGESEIVPFDRATKAMGALKEGEVDVMFGDGISLMFWVNGTSSQNCCAFLGGPFIESRYFGEGIGIAVLRGNRKMRQVLDYGLARVRASGRYEELLRRYFPFSVL